MDTGRTFSTFPTPSESMRKFVPTLNTLVVQIGGGRSLCRERLVSEIGHGERHGATRMTATTMVAESTPHRESKN